jgi:hypothetical protein
VGFSGTTITNLEIFQSSNRFAGAVCEDCIVDGSLGVRPGNYANVLSAMMQIDAIPRASFVELNTAYAPAGSYAQIAQRLVTTAVAWLGYADGHTIVFPDLETNTNNLAIWPEDAIYPSRPLQTMSSSPNDIAVAPGVWRREFAACYDGGVPIGPCAALLNANPNSVKISSAWLTQTYGHVVSIAGGDLLSGGSINLSSVAFVPNGTLLGGSVALLLVK